jgi:hypothetical protein
VGRCKFRRTLNLIEHLLHATLGGFPRAFDVVQLSDRVFRFSVASQLVGFHIYDLCSFECVDYKVSFHLWHNGGPNYLVEYRNWQLEQAAEWKEVANRKTVCLTGANSVPISHHRPPTQSSKFMEFSKSENTFNVGRKSVFKRIDSGMNKTINHFDGGMNRPVNLMTVSYLEVGILGPIPDSKCLISSHGSLLQLCSICLSPAHSRPVCKNSFRCRRCLRFGHIFEFCNIPPRSSRLPNEQIAPSHSRNHRAPKPLISGPLRQNTPVIFPSVSEYIKVRSGLSTIPSPVTVPWSKSWRLQAPEFIDEDDPAFSFSVLAVSSAPSSPLIFSSFGEYASKVLGIPPLLVLLMLLGC